MRRAAHWCPNGRCHRRRRSRSLSQLSALAVLALSAFLSATLLPGTSEALLVALAIAEVAPIAALLLVAGAANVAGSSVNWLIGRQAERLRGSRWFPVGESALERAQRWFGRYGHWSLLMSWLPIVGDPLTVVAGIMRMPFATFLLMVAIAKFGRYAALLWLAGAWPA